MRNKHFQYGSYRAPYGEFGAYLTEKLVIKLYGWSEDIILLDHISGLFNLKRTNPRIIERHNNEWLHIYRLLEHYYSSRIVDRVLVMERLFGVPMCDTFENSIWHPLFRIQNPLCPSIIDKRKISNLCSSIGRMLVMDLLIRNKDRFNLSTYDDYLLTTNKEKNAGNNWRYWTGNYSNIIVDTRTWTASPVDSMFTYAVNEDVYCENVIYMLTTKKEELASFILNHMSYNWAKTKYAQLCICDGINHGIASVNKVYDFLSLYKNPL